MSSLFQASYNSHSLLMLWYTFTLASSPSISSLCLLSAIFIIGKMLMKRSLSQNNNKNNSSKKNLKNNQLVVIDSSASYTTHAIFSLLAQLSSFCS